LDRARASVIEMAVTSTDEIVGTRTADISVNAGPKHRVLFPYTFHANNFWNLTIPVQLEAVQNTVRFSAEELPDFGTDTYISDRYTEPLRSRNAPVIDRIGITRYSR
jgi:hypothetical protein